jgi:TRAP-type C4-dicarboxylate transport system permease small subunit
MQMDASWSKEMERLLINLSSRLSAWMEMLAGITLMGVTLLIGVDIVGRIFGYPVPGAYEVVSFMGGLVIGLALPATSMAKGHVSTDLLLSRLPVKGQTALIAITRLIGAAVFLIAGSSMIVMGVRLKLAGEVTAVLALPFYHLLYAMGGAFFVQSLVLIAQIVALKSGQNNPDSQT